MELNNLTLESVLRSLRQLVRASKAFLCESTDYLDQSKMESGSSSSAKLTMVRQSSKQWLFFYSGRSSVCSGVTMIVLGILTFGLGLTRRIVVDTNLWQNGYEMVYMVNISTGIWCGILFVFFGLISISAGKCQKKSLVALHAILSVSAVIFAAVLIAISTVNIGLSFSDDISPSFRPSIRITRPCLLDQQSTTNYWDRWNRGTTTPNYYWRLWNPETTTANYYWKFWNQDASTTKPDYWKRLDQSTTQNNSYWWQVQTKVDSNQTTSSSGYDSWGLNVESRKQFRRKRYPYRYDTDGSYNNNGGYGRFDCYEEHLNYAWIVQLVMSCGMALMGIVVFIISIVSATLAFAPFCCFKQAIKQSFDNYEIPIQPNLTRKEDCVYKEVAISVDDDVPLLNNRDVIHI